MHKRNVAIMYALLAIASVGIIWPFIQMGLASFMTFGESVSTPPKLLPSAIQIENYKKVFTVVPFGTLYLNSVITTSLRVFFALVICTLSGYAFAKFDFYGKGIAFWIILGIMMVPTQMFTLPQYLTMSRMGLLNTLTAIILPNAFSAYGIFMMRQFFMKVPDEIIESATIDGSSPFRTFYSVALPLIKPGAIVLGIQFAIGAWNDLFWPLIVNRSMSKLTLPASIALMSGQYTTDIPTQMAAAVMAVVPMVVIYVCVQNSFKDLDFSAAIK